MISQINPPIGVVSHIEGKVIVKSNGETHILKMGDVIHREDVVNITDHGNLKVLMVDGTSVNIDGTLPFDFHDYLLIENETEFHQKQEKQQKDQQHQEHQEHHQAQHSHSVEAIQHIIQSGVQPEVISDAINSCISLDKPENDNHGSNMIIVPIIESLTDYISVSTQHLNSELISPISYEQAKPIETPSSQFPIVEPVEVIPPPASPPVLSSNLVVTETVSDPNPLDGEIIVYTITVSNLGNGEAQNVVVTDILPVGINFISANDSGVDNSGVVSWNVGNLSPGSSIVLSFTAQVTDPSLAEVFNLATVSTTSNNIFTAPQGVAIDPIPTTDLSVFKSISALNFEPYLGQAIYDGDTVTFSIVATNNGPNAATSVNVNDLLPVGLDFISANVIDGTYNSSTGVWNIGNLDSSQSETLLLTAQVNDTSLATETNIATISGNEHDANLSNNTTSLDITPLASADLNIIESIDNFFPYNGTIVTITFTASNIGPEDATGVSVGRFFFANDDISFISATPSVGTYTDFGAGFGGWDIGNLANGESETLVVTALITDPNLNLIQSDGTISGDQHDPTLFAAGLGIQPLASSDLVISNLVDNISPFLGQTITYTIQVTNNGFNDATNVKVTDLLPTGIDFVSAAATIGSYDNNTGLWSLGTLAASASSTLTITATDNYPRAELGYSGLIEATPVYFNGVGIYTYILGSNFSDNGLIDATSLAAANGTGTNVNVSSPSLQGLGVEGGGSTTTAIESNSSGQTEALVIDLAANSAYANGITTADFAMITLSDTDDNLGTQGEVTAYNSAGIQVGGPVVFQDLGSGFSSITISPGADFQYLVFTALPSSSGGISSYYVANISYLPESVNNTATVTTDSHNLNLVTTASAPIHLEVPVADNGQAYHSPSDTFFGGNLFSDTGSNLGNNTPAYIKSIALIGDGYTYVYDGVSNITTEGSGISSHTLLFGQLLINLPSLGGFGIYLDNSAAGDYSFAITAISPAPVPYTLPIQFTLSDSGLNQATGMLTLTDINQFDFNNSGFTYNGNGSDILEFSLNSGSVDLTGNANIHNIGMLLCNDDAFSTGTTLTLSPNDVFDFTEDAAHSASGNSNTLFINGNANDTVHIGTIGPGGWTDMGAASGYEVYTQTINSHNVTLEVQQAVHVVA